MNMYKFVYVGVFCVAYNKLLCKSDMELVVQYQSNKYNWYKDVEIIH